MPAMTYSLVATSLSEAALHTVQSKALIEFLPAMGYEPTFPRAIVHGPRQYGGINLGHLYTEMCIAKIESVISHIQAGTGLGKIFLLNLNWLQLLSGQSQPLLQYCDPLPYLETNWFLHLRQFLYTISGSIVIQDLWLPKIERRNDKILMDHIIENSTMTNAEHRIFNNWRLYFKVSVLSDIVTPDGTTIQDMYWQPMLFTERNSLRISKHNWPIQHQPDWDTFRIWKKGIKTTFHVSVTGVLSQRLGDWHTTFLQSYNTWQYYWDNITRSLYARQSDDMFWSHQDYQLSPGLRYTYSSVPDEISTLLPHSAFPVQVQQIDGTFIRQPWNSNWSDSSKVITNTRYLR